MSITKAQADAELVDRCGGMLAAAGRSTLTDGNNPATVGPLRDGLASLGLSTASYGAVTNTDLAVVTSAQLPQLIDVAELRLLRNVLNWLTKVDQKISMGEIKWGQLRDGLLKSIADLEARCKDLYGYGAASISAGRLGLNFAQTDPCNTEPLYEDCW